MGYACAVFQLNRLFDPDSPAALFLRDVRASYVVVQLGLTLIIRGFFID